MASPRFSLTLLLLFSACASPAPMIEHASESRRYAALPAPGETRNGCGQTAARDPRFRRSLDGAALDLRLMNAALLHASNRARCLRGIGALRPDPAISAAAQMHSTDMARHGFIGHRSPIRNRHRFSDRMRLTGARFGRASETIATANRLAYDEGSAVYPLGGHCAYSTAPNGPPLPVRSYGAVADQIVMRWLKSTNHRDSLLDPGFRRQGTGAAIATNIQVCERIIVTQLYTE